MKILSFTTAQNTHIHKYQNNNLILLNNLSSDCFVKSPSFGTRNEDNSFQEFQRWAKDTNFTDNALEIIEKTGKVLGSGFEGTTYSIPGNEKWVIKQFNRTSLINQSLKKPEILPIKDISPELNIGQAIASVKIPVGERYSQHFYILKKQAGSSYGVPLSCKDIVSDSTTKRHLDSLKNMAGLPISSYEKLIDDITYVNKRGYKFDVANPYNFMVDWNNKSVNFVDIADKLDDKNSRQYGDVLFSLLDADFGCNFEYSSRSLDEKNKASLLSTRICSKFLSAMIRKHVKLELSDNFNKVFMMDSFGTVIGANNTQDKLEKLKELGLY